MRTKLKDDEQLIFEINKHWFVLVIPVLLALVSVLGLLYLSIKGLNDYYLVLFIVTVVFVFNFLYRYYDWKTNIWIISNMRVIDEWGVFSHNAKESPLDKIHNVTFNQSVTGRVFNYGDVSIQTAADQGASVNSFVKSPKQLKSTISQCQDIYENRKVETRSRAIEVKNKESNSMECPYCAERIKSKAKICRFCRKEVGDSREVSSSNALKIITIFLFLLLTVLYSPGFAEEIVKPDMSANQSSFYYENVKQGWWWYDDKFEVEPDKEMEPAKEISKPARKLPSLKDYPPEQLRNMYPDDFQELLIRFQKKAVMSPTVANVKEYYMVQDIARRKAQAFTSVTSLVMQKYPELSVSSEYPITSPGRVAFLRQREHEIASKLLTSQTEFALIYFYSPDCLFCTAQESIFHHYVGKYGWQIKRIDINENLNLASSFNVRTVPYTILVYKKSKEHLPISAGVISMSEMEEKIYRGMRYLKGDISPDQYLMYEHQRGGLFDPAAVVKPVNLTTESTEVRE